VSATYRAINDNEEKEGEILQRCLDLFCRINVKACVSYLADSDCLLFGSLCIAGPVALCDSWSLRRIVVGGPPSVALLMHDNSS
jgi:hypothetical protein